jgi:hypothetical protein
MIPTHELIVRLQVERLISPFTQGLLEVELERRVSTLDEGNDCRRGYELLFGDSDAAA